MPTTVDELCYELRIDSLHSMNMTVTDLKERLLARGEASAGNRETSMSRFILAGALYKPIKDIYEYKRIAKRDFIFLKGFLPTRTDNMIDVLLARCPSS